MAFHAERNTALQRISKLEERDKRRDQYFDSLNTMLEEQRFSIQRIENKLDNHIIHTDERFLAVNQAIEELDGKVAVINARVAVIDNKVAVIDNKVSVINDKVEAVNKNLEGFRSEVDQRFDRLETAIHKILTVVSGD